jgi:hypothetical protein
VTALLIIWLWRDLVEGEGPSFGDCEDSRDGGGKENVEETDTL